MEDTSSFLLLNIGAPFLVGMAVGYFTKKALKIGLFIIGMTIVILLVSSHYGIVEIHGEQLATAVDGGKDAANTFGSFLINSLSGLGGIGASGVAGFFVGLKVG